MNRAGRRRLKKQFKGQNIQINPGVEKIDHSKANFCWLHNLKIDDIDNPTPRDKKLIESIRLQPFKAYDKSGNLILGRSCPRCKLTIIVDNKLIDSTKEGIILIPGEKDNELAIPVS